MTTYLTTPPMALIRIVIRLIGIGGERSRFVRKISINPTLVLRKQKGRGDRKASQ